MILSCVILSISKAPSRFWISQKKHPSWIQIQSQSIGTFNEATGADWINQAGSYRQRCRSFKHLSADPAAAIRVECHPHRSASMERWLKFWFKLPREYWRFCTGTRQIKSISSSRLNEVDDTNSRQVANFASLNQVDEFTGVMSIIPDTNSVENQPEKNGSLCVNPSKLHRTKRARFSTGTPIILNETAGVDLAGLVRS